ncbi:MAG: efflux RND transporter periplasmic adaptor subunit [Victivallaceae bacterium]|nr:efflux RND transporter periplasmic adaptor subunit [Victivallaceae bacterium]
MKLFWKISAIAAAALIIAAAILYQTGGFRSGLIVPGEQQPDKKKIPGRRFKLVPTAIPVIYRTVGTVRSRDEIELSPRIVARILKITRRSGDSVKAGEVLVELDDSDLKAGERQAAENLNAAEAVLQWAVKDYRRQKMLLDKNVVPRKTFEQSEQVWKSALAAEKAARQALRQVQANRSYATLRSPMDGVISDRLNDPGDLASPGSIILKIFDASRLMLYVPLRESLVRSVKIGDKIRFQVESLKQDFTGEVKEIVPSVDPGSRTFLIKMCIQGDIKGLMPGMFGLAELRLGTEPAYIVPAAAVTRIGQLEYLTKIQDGKPAKVLVRTVSGPTPDTLRVVAGIDSDTELILPPGNNRKFTDNADI